MKKAHIYLDKINWNKYHKVIKLRVNKDPRYFVASNEASLIHAFIEMSCGTPVYAFAIMNGKTVVGFIQIMYSKDWSGYEREDWLNSDDFKKHNGKPVYYIWRFMIDKKYQQRGYGREALNKALDFIKHSLLEKSNMFSCLMNQVTRLERNYMLPLDLRKYSKNIYTMMMKSPLCLNYSYV